MSKTQEELVSVLQQPAAGKKPYSSPQLFEWGSIIDLTQGNPSAGFDDFPLVGGTKGV